MYCDGSADQRAEFPVDAVGRLHQHKAVSLVALKIARHCRKVLAPLPGDHLVPAAHPAAVRIEIERLYWSDGTQSLGMLEILKNGRGTDGVWSE